MGFHDGPVVIDLTEQDRLVAQGNAGIGQAPQGVTRFGGQLPGMVGVDADEKRVVSAEHGAELRGNALGQENGDAGADAEELDMRNGAQLAEQKVELLVAQQEGVAPAQQHVPDCGMAADIIHLAVELRMEVVAGGIADEARAGAIAAIGGTPIGDQKKDAVGVAVDQSRHR